MNPFRPVFFCSICNADASGHGSGRLENIDKGALWSDIVLKGVVG
jgi:hypothetical protein